MPPVAGRKERKKMNEELKNAAKEKAMVDLFNAAAHAQYMLSTRKSFEEVRTYLTKHTKKWSEVAKESDFYTINDCVAAARNVALRVVEKENFRRFFDSLDSTILKS